jgi:hypothetical protein
MLLVYFGLDDYSLFDDYTSKSVPLYLRERLQCSETLLTGEPGSIVSAGASPGREVLAGIKRLIYCTSETVNWNEAAGPPLQGLLHRAPS